VDGGELGDVVTEKSHARIVTGPGKPGVVEVDPVRHPVPVKKLNGRILAAGVTISVTLLLGGCWIATRSERSSADDLAERVANQFVRCAEDIPAKEGGTPTPMPYVVVDTVLLADGTRVSLWVSDLPLDSPIRTRCFYLDRAAAGGDTAVGVGGGGAIDELVMINREQGVLYGTVGTWPAARVRLAGGGVDAEARVVRGHFLVPAADAPATATYTITLLDADGGVLAVASDLVPPASASASPEPTR
jgi:hypothetical protein